MRFFIPLFLFFVFLTSCADKGNQLPAISNVSSTSAASAFFYSGDSVDFYAYKTKIPVICFDDQKNLSECQKNAEKWFEDNQLNLFPKIEAKLFDYYQKSYPNYKKTWSSDSKMTEKEISRYLPYPFLPDTLLGYIKPVAFVLHTEKNCSENSFSIVFDCSWDPNYGLGVYVENGDVKFVSLGQRTYPD